MTEAVELTKAVLFDIVSKAGFAPSSHNSQPWKFKLVPSEGNDASARIHVFADGTLRLKHTDLDGRELLMSCGAAIGTILIEIQARALTYELEYAPIADPCNPEQFEIAVVKVMTAGKKSDDAIKLASHIEARTTYRNIFDETPVTEDEIKKLKGAVSSVEGCWLHILPRERRQLLADMVEEANDVQWSHAEWRQELSSWIQPTSTGSGLHIGPDFLNPLTKKFIAWFKFPGNSQGSKDKSFVLWSPVIAILGCDKREPYGWIKAGIALQKMLLVAYDDNIVASYLNQPLQVKQFSYLRVSEAIGRSEGTPCLIIRLGKLSRSTLQGLKRSARKQPELNII